MSKRVYVLENHDYGDNGWSIAGVYASRKTAELAKQRAEDKPDCFGYFEVESFPLRGVE